MLWVTVYDFLDAGHSTWLKRLQCDVVLSVGQLCEKEICVCSKLKSGPGRKFLS